MRKSPTFSPRVCGVCGKTYTPTGAMQQFCLQCRALRDKTHKREWYERNFPDRTPKQKTSEVCCVCGGQFTSHFNGKPYCNVHYQRMYNYGDTERRERKSKNTYEINGSETTGTTTNGKTFLIDTSDLDTVRRYSWCFSKTGYLVANNGNKVIRLHRYLLDAPSGIVVDHINGDPSDNRRCNLRLCSQKDNSRNCRPTKGSKTGIVGVKITESGRYVAQIMVDGKLITIGNYATLNEAAKARCKAELKYYGEFSPTISRTLIKTPDVDA